MIVRDRARMSVGLLLAIMWGSTPVAALEIPAAHDGDDAHIGQSRSKSATDDDTAQFALAQRLLRADEPADALEQFTALASRQPANVDYSLGRAQALARLERPRAALEELQHAISLAPDYEAPWRLRFAILNTDPELVADVELQAYRSEAQARFPAARWWQRTAAPPDWRGQLTLSGTVEVLSDNLPGWNSQSARLDWRATGSTQLFAAAAREERFDLSDRTLSVGVRHEFPGRWHAGAEIDAASNASFVPESGFAAFAGRQLGHGWVAEARVRQRNYSAATVTTWSAGAERYFSDYRLAYTLNFSRLHGLTDSVSHMLSANWYRSAQTSFSVTIAAGHEAESVGPGQVLESAVASLTIGGRHALNRRFTLHWWLGSHEQGDFYRRRYAGMAVTAGF
ncbi:MAG TPA: YaiO family outer membrane beta-barrel protein [Woeseiaceae bacterium]|nr:YaiO family outer membrane beta-barrel protein [Woeseiaceae bacterium]